jgi:Acetyltransferase (GNAT) domain
MSVRLRRLVPADAALLGDLHARVNPASAWPSPAAYAGYALEMLFRNPWADPELPSWVAEEQGRLIAFLGVMPRRMRLGGRALRVAVSCQLMVDPGKRASFVALELVRRFFAGPQDLSLADGANDASRALWESCGGISSSLHALHWVRLLRPAQGLLRLAGVRLRALFAVAQPVAAVFDACVGQKFRTEFEEEPLHPGGLSAAMAESRGYALKPDYDPAALEWLLAQAAAKRRHGSLEGALARDASGRVAGWFLYYLNGSISQVLQLGARRGALPALLEQLAHHAYVRGARALEGRMEPQLTVALQRKRVFMQNRGVSTLLHARDERLLIPFLRGDAFFSRLEGEWWMRFAGEPQAAPSGSSTGFAAPATRVELPHVGA